MDHINANGSLDSPQAVNISGLKKKRVASMPRPPKRPSSLETAE
jgi:hypothetical protein